MARLPFVLVFITVTLLVTSACSPPAGDGDGDSDADADGDGGEGECDEGDWRCWGAAYQECADGVWENALCDGVCVEEIGCTACRPGERYCEGDTVMECNEDGSSAEVVLECDIEAGDQCTGGFCSNACDEARENRSNLGCEYWAVDLDNAENDFSFFGLPNMGDNAAGGQFAVAVANPEPHLSAHVTVEINTAPYGEEIVTELVAEVDVGPGELQILELPRRDADGDNITLHVDDGPQTWLSSRAFRIESTLPVVAYQFNTLDQRFSNDASLLLPTSGLDTHHIVLGLPPANAVRVPGFSIPPSRAYVTVIGTEADTEVTIVPTSRTLAGGDVPALEPGEEYTFTLGPYDMLNLETDTVTMGEAMRGNYPDLTGTVVTSDAPVAVFSGADLTVVGPEGSSEEDDSCCAEHIESQILPTSAMGTRFVVSRSPVRSRSTPEVDIYRVIAAVDGTEVTTNLSGAAASFTLDAGEYLHFQSNTPFILESNENHPVHVGQFLISQGYVGDHVIGDPSFLMFPAVEEWRGAYIFTTGRGFSEDYVVIALPETASATLDGADIFTPFCDDPVPIGDIDGASYVQVTCPIEDGVHTVDSGEYPVGVTVYGYYNAGSYSYSAGSELHRIFLI